MHESSLSRSTSTSTVYLRTKHPQYKMQRNYQKCAVANCHKRQDLNPKVKFFCFPANNERCLLWLRLINNNNLRNVLVSTIRHYYSVCEHHFDSNQFQTPQCLKLNRNAEPTKLREKENQGLTTECQIEPSSCATNKMQLQEEYVAIEDKMEMDAEEMCTNISTSSNENTMRLPITPYETHMELSTPIMEIAGKSAYDDVPSTSKGLQYSVVKYSYKQW